MHLITRQPPPRAAWSLEQAGVHPLLARLFASRGVSDASEIDDTPHQLLKPDQLKGLREAVDLLMQAIGAEHRICIVGDYDCDGATACAVAIRGLRALGARHVDFIVPDRVTDGYGLSPAIAQRVAASGARLLITVDNGIASIEGVSHARALGLQVLVTDHHLPGPALPAADAIVNPNQPGCEFASRHLAGVGVMFYVLLALRAGMREAGLFANGTQPRLDGLLPLVALGTVADVVRLDANNRRLVALGLKRIRAGQAAPGIVALLQTANRDPMRASALDLGFAVGPRINAAGRLADMRLGIECLLSDDEPRAVELAGVLDGINRERRDIEADMRDLAMDRLQSVLSGDGEPGAAICVFDAAFHEGVVGIVAARLKDRFHRPTFVFAPARLHEADGIGQAVLKGSGRSIAGFHLRDALDLVSKREPEVLLRFGGHAMAAGCTIHADALPRFQAAFAQVAAEWIDPARLARELETDGPLPEAYRRHDVAEMLQSQVWGQGFPPPLFCEDLEVVSQRLVGQGHLALKLKHAGQVVDGIWFGRSDPLPPRPRLAFRLDADEFQGMRRVRFVVEAAEEPAS